MGLRTLLIYLLSVVGGAIIFALSVDYILPRQWFTSHLEQIHTCGHEHTHWFNIGCSILLLILLLNALYRRYFHKGGCGHHHCHCHDEACHCSNQEGEVLTLHIKGMSCNHCRANVEKVIKEIPGITHVKVSLTDSQAIIYGQASPEAIRQAVESIGFDVED